MMIVKGAGLGGLDLGEHMVLDGTPFPDSHAKSSEDSGCVWNSGVTILLYFFLGRGLG